MLPFLKNIFRDSPKQGSRQVSTQFEVIDEPQMKKIEQEYKEKQEVRPRASLEFQQQPIIQIQKEEEETIYFDHIVSGEDSLFGISLKYNIRFEFMEISSSSSVDLLKKINDLSGDMIFQGMTIKIPYSLINRSSIRRISYQRQGEEQQQKMATNVWNQEKDLTYQFPMYYCTDSQNIPGNLTITKDVIFFDPVEQQSQDQLSKRRKSKPAKKFNACISVRDINEAVYYVLPEQNGQKNYVLQILLSGIGKKEFEKKYRKRLQKYKNIKRSIATIFFRLVNKDEYKDKEFLITKIPFIDLIHENLHMKKIEQDQVQNDQLNDMIGERVGRVWTCIEYIPILEENSNCLNESMYKQLIQKIPAVFRLAKWRIKFDLQRDGSSYSTLFQNLKYEYPILMAIKDFDGNIFGAYMPVELQFKQLGFYGNGETFLFQFNVTQTGQISVYHWSELNDCFIQTDSDGLGVGCGEKYGLYIDKDLIHGYNNPCETFNNPQFTKEEKFKIKYLEVWTILMD